MVWGRVPEAERPVFFDGFARRSCDAVGGGPGINASGEPAHWLARTSGRLFHYAGRFGAAAPTETRLRYSLPVQRASSSSRTSSQGSPTLGLLLGLVITLAAVVAYSTYITVQLSGLRKLQSDMVDRNRKDSLQLLRLQNDLNTVALAMRDMLDAGEPYPLSAWLAQFERVRV